jgi:hypothetical protein
MCTCLDEIQHGLNRHCLIRFRTARILNTGICGVERDCEVKNTMRAMRKERRYPSYFVCIRACRCSLPRAVLTEIDDALCPRITLYLSGLIEDLLESHLDFRGINHGEEVMIPEHSATAQHIRTEIVFI